MSTGWTPLRKFERGARKASWGPEGITGPGAKSFTVSALLGYAWCQKTFHFEPIARL